MRSFVGSPIMASDTPEGMTHREGSSITVSLSGDDGDELRRFWDGLADGGTVTMPLEKAMWGDTFGMVVDRYGVNWLVNISGSAA